MSVLSHQVAQPALEVLDGSPEVFSENPAECQSPHAVFLLCCILQFTIFHNIKASGFNGASVTHL